jgi:hypothetical protein
VIRFRFCTRVYIILQGCLPPKKYPQIHRYLKFGRGGFPPPHLTYGTFLKRTTSRRIPFEFLFKQLSSYSRRARSTAMTNKQGRRYGPRLAGNASSCGSGEDVDDPMGCRSHNNQPGTDPMPITGRSQVRCPLG